MICLFVLSVLLVLPSFGDSTTTRNRNIIGLKLTPSDILTSILGIHKPTHKPIETTVIPTTEPITEPTTNVQTTSNLGPKITDNGSEPIADKATGTVAEVAAEVMSQITYILKVLPPTILKIVEVLIPLLANLLELFGIMIMG